MNINDVSLCPIHTAYETVCVVAHELGVEVTGTELIGLIPEDCMVEAGRYFADKQSIALIEKEDFITLAVEEMHMDDFCSFDIQQKVLVV